MQLKRQLSSMPKRAQRKLKNNSTRRESNPRTNNLLPLRKSKKSKKSNKSPRSKRRRNLSRWLPNRQIHSLCHRECVLCNRFPRLQLSASSRKKRSQQRSSSARLQPQSKSLKPRPCTRRTEPPSSRYSRPTASRLLSTSASTT